MAQAAACKSQSATRDQTAEASAARPSNAMQRGELSRRATCLLAGTLLLAAVAALAVDIRLSSWVLSFDVPSDLRKLISLSEVFAHGMGVALILLVVAVLDPAHWRALPRLAAAAYGAGLWANVGKSLVARVRPHHADLEAGVVETFQGWLPFLWSTDATPAWTHALQSFPSGHTATAVGLAIALAWRFPRGRWLFAGLAILAACQRIESGSHYLSDTLAAASLATIWASLCLGAGPLNRLFSRIEGPSVVNDAPPQCSMQPAHAPGPSGEVSRRHAQNLLRPSHEFVRIARKGYNEAKQEGQDSQEGIHDDASMYDGRHVDR